jgi:hypothetical protein
MGGSDSMHAGGQRPATSTCLGTTLLLQTRHGIYDYGSPDYMPFWPRGMSGVCLGAIINFAFHVLTFMQPTSPAKAIVQFKPNRAMYQPSSTQEQRLTLNNVCGYLFPYGELKHLPPPDDPVAPPVPASTMAGIISAAINSAPFWGNCWAGVRAAGAGMVRLLAMQHMCVCARVHISPVCAVSM